jgi:hypothetical protein
VRTVRNIFRPDEGNRTISYVDFSTNSYETANEKGNAAGFRCRAGPVICPPAGEGRFLLGLSKASRSPLAARRTPLNVTTTSFVRQHWRLYYSLLFIVPKEEEIFKMGLTFSRVWERMVRSRIVECRRRKTSRPWSLAIAFGVWDLTSSGSREKNSLRKF